MDYYGLPNVKSYLQPFVFAVDMAANAAAIPGSGDTPVAFTHTFDVAKFVAALVGQPDWPERSVIIGDKRTWNEVVAIAEDVKGWFLCACLYLPSICTLARCVNQTNSSSMEF
jgi:nucleoside-diphosphate-sugar epimerase